MDIGNQISKYRKQKSLTQEQLGEKLGVSNRTVSKWEAGKSIPGADLIPAITAALDITFDEFFETGLTLRKEDISETIRQAIHGEAEEVIPGLYATIQSAVEDAVEESFSSCYPPYSGNQHSVTIITKSKNKTVKCDGKLYISPYTDKSGAKKYRLVAAYFNDSDIVGSYDSIEGAKADLEKVYKAYSSKLETIEL